MFVLTRDNISLSLIVLPIGSHLDQLAFAHVLPCCNTKADTLLIPLALHSLSSATLCFTLNSSVYLIFEAVALAVLADWLAYLPNMASSNSGIETRIA
jgi:hypothetical protein